MKKLLLALFAIVLVGAVVACSPQSQEDTSANLSQQCVQYNGTWLEEHQECEGIPRLACETLGGEFDPCASACRHDPSAEFCTMQCVPVCSFENASQTKNVST